METTSPWPIAMRYGLILAFTQIIINLVFYIIAPESVENTMSAMGIIQMLLVAILSIYIMHHGTSKRRDEELGGAITYNKSLGFMLRMALPAAFVVSVYTFIFIKYINSGMMDKAMEMQAQEMYNKGMSEEQIDQAMGMAKKMTSPAIVTAMGMIGSMIMFFIYALIASIFSKKVPVTDNH